MPHFTQIFIFLFLTLGPIKTIGPFVKMTRKADAVLTRRIAIRAILFSCLALLVASLLGENFLNKYNIPLPILKLSGGIMFFLVALLNIIQQFTPTISHEETDDLPTLSMAMTPLAFPTIVTPYGIAAVIVFMTLSTDLESRLIIGAMVLGMMVLNLLVMLIAKRIIKYLAVILPILGAVLGVVQVSLGLMIIYNSFKELFKI
jgi:multiple antibiotic resistance protein